MRRTGGFTLIELVVTVAIIALLATLAFPMAEVAMKRTKERELRESLRQIRTALDAYKQAVDDRRVKQEAGSSGYPPNLRVLYEGVSDDRNPDKERKIYFIRRLPKDPMNSEPGVSAEDSWGRRSYASGPEAPQEGADVFDVYSKSVQTGMNGIPYSRW